MKAEIKVGFKSTYKGWNITVNYGALNISPTAHIFMSGNDFFHEIMLKHKELQAPSSYEGIIRKQKREMTVKMLQKLLDFTASYDFSPSGHMYYTDDELMRQIQRYIDNNLGSAVEYTKRKCIPNYR